MGNCIDVLCYSSAEKSKVLIHNGGEKEFKASTRIRKITSGRYCGHMLVHSALPYAPLPPETRLEPGEVYYLVPPLDQPCRLEVSSKLAGQETCTGRKVKIVVTRQQLELLLRSSKQLKSKGITVRISESFKEGDRKWQPTLVTIPEITTCSLRLAQVLGGGDSVADLLMYNV
ncbi:unnamed protein product [Dovyalis caffra]|uniref:Uncharacterized protein n=1 Tax=Dovyalis caffra TaxID=77055 RepID=A0AAV1QR79_9ROSI|nr:unnamed protein product [Dovyalis caffra]